MSTDYYRQEEPAGVTEGAMDPEPSGSVPAPQIVLSLDGIAKSYGPTTALRRAGLRLRAGRVHALLGENGAGKSTLVKIAAGALRPDAGLISLSGRELRLRSVRDGIEAGIVPIYQHLSLFPHLSVLENLSAFAYGRPGGFGIGPRLVPEATAASWLATVGLSRADLAASVERLSVGERQLVELARGIGQNCRVLILDEPTAALTDRERDRLFAAIRRLCQDGTAILFISHKLDEVEEISDEITILRDGKTVVEAAGRGELGRDALVRKMLGAAVSAAEHGLPTPGPIVLRASRLVLDERQPAIDVAVRAGEILGVAGLIGSGALDLAEALAGARRVASGTVNVGPDAIRPGNRRQAAALGVGYVPADRNADGIFGVLPAMQNASASALPTLSRAGMLRAGTERAVIAPWLKRLALHPLRPDLLASRFSGGNQQKLVVARNLALPGLRVLVAIEPTRGVDLAARRTIHEALVEAAVRGVAVVLASTDVDEIESLSHRLLVLEGGRLRAELARGASREAILTAMGGQEAEAA